MGETRGGSVLISTLCLLLGASPLLGQSGAIAGRITGADTGRPIVGALVEALGAGARRVGDALTNQAGEFRISGLEPGVYTLSVAAFGYGTQATDRVQVTSARVATVSIALEPRPIELNPLVVSSSRKVEKALEAPAHVAVVSERELMARPALTPVDHLRSTPGVDVVTGGLQATRVVTRGFNSSFSGALYTLTDNRMAAVPSMRVNFMYMMPQTTEDVRRMEVVLGPGAALYGPNTANGVLHVITKSPIDDPGSTISVAAGERHVLHFTGRTAVRLSDRFGFKISGQYFQGHDWQHREPEEEAERQAARDNFEAWKLEQTLGLTEVELHRRAGRIGARDFDVSRYSLDARADWRPTANLSAILTAGRTITAKGIEISGVGAAMLEDWAYGYYQARLSYGRWFAQAYLNTSDAGGTFMLQNGAPIVDRSKLWVAQLQHGTTWRNLELTYGGDLVRTMPATGGTIHGSYEGGDSYTEYGAYLQSKAAVSPRLDLVLAGRWDRHTALADPVLSPRAGLVFKPAPDQTFRVTYNRAFATPNSLDLFIDMDAGPAGSLGPLGFRIRAHGSGKDGIRFADRNGWPLGMWVPGQSGLVPVTAANVFDAQLELLNERLRSDSATAGLVPLMQQLGSALKAGAVQVPVVALDPVTKTTSPVTGSVTDLPGIRPSIATVWEMGYQGLIGDRILLAADAWRSTETAFTSSLLVRTPLYLLDSQQFRAFLTQNAASQIAGALVENGLSEAAAQQQAQTLIANWVQIPGGVAASPDIPGSGADLIAAFVNLGEIALWGLDLSARWLISDAWSVNGTYSHVSDHSFCLVDPGATGCDEDNLLALNAPQDKLTASLAYRGPNNGFSSEVRVRHTGAFPVNTAIYVGLECIGGGGEPCVEPYTLFDATLGYDLPMTPGASVQLGITNLFNEPYRSFVGVPEVGRLALLRLRYEF